MNSKSFYNGRIKILTSFTVCNSLEELSGNVFLRYTTIISIRKAYAPYSRFKVGAAMLMDNEEIIVKNNQERACCPSGSCIHLIK